MARSYLLQGREGHGFRNAVMIICELFYNLLERQYSRNVSPEAKVNRFRRLIGNASACMLRRTSWLDTITFNVKTPSQNETAFEPEARIWAAKRGEFTQLKSFMSRCIVDRYAMQQRDIVTTPLWQYTLNTWWLLKSWLSPVSLRVKYLAQLGAPSLVHYVFLHLPYEIIHTTGTITANPSTVALVIHGR